MHTKPRFTRQGTPAEPPVAFRDASGSRDAVRLLLQEDGPVRAIVSYWGQGAIEDLGIKRGADLTVVCDLRSGACNIQVVKHLQKLLGRERVMTCDRLHAKTWIGRDRAVAGSSNASANGLGFEGGEARALIEANVVVYDAATVAALHAWAEATVAGAARTITAADFRAAARNAAGRRRGRPLPDHGNLLDLLGTSPEALIDRDAVVWVFDHVEPDPWAKREITAVQRDRKDDTIDYFCVEDDAVAAGSHILDFDTSGGTIAFAGLWLVLQDHHLHKDPGGEGTLLLCRAVTKFGHLPLGSLVSWKRAARKAALTDEDEWTLAEFANRFLG